MNLSQKNNIPWVEKYRPTKFDNIVLDPNNRTLFKNILEKNYFPNLLFYGPPGTGKTTTIINLINEYQKKYNNNSKTSVIHLNASDERGIDIIRNQINQFVKSRNLFENGLKFVILDEVDYMTKNAQQALKYLLQTSNYNVRFCLICNYISKIDDSLQNEFICIRFNQLPKKDIFFFIKNICGNENIGITDEIIEMIISIYNSDIRSMINFIQLNQNIEEWDNNIINNIILEEIHTKIIYGVEEETMAYLHQISIDFNKDKKNIIRSYFYYVIKKYENLVNKDFLFAAESIVHNNDAEIEFIVKFFVNCFSNIYSKIIDTNKPNRENNDELMKRWISLSAYV
jgi:replication factor C subunit 3/5